MTAQQAMEAALVSHRAGRVEEAITGYRKALELRPDFMEASANLSGLLRKTGRLDEGIEICRRALVHHPKRPELHFNLANLLQDAEQTDEAIVHYRRAIAVLPNYAEAHSNLGNALRKKGDLVAAIAAYSQAVRVKPDYAEAFSNLGVALVEAGRLEEGIAAHVKSIQLNPGNAAAHNNMGSALRERRDLTGAIAAYSNAIRLRPNYAEAYLNLGAGLSDAGRLDEAIAACSKAIELQSTSAQAHNNLGMALTAVGRFDDATAAFFKAIELRPDSPDTFNHLGIARAGKRDFDGAIAAYKNAVKLKPEFAEAHNNLGIIYKEQGNLDAALEWFNKAMALKGDFAEAHGNLLMTLHYHPNRSAAEIFAEHRQWGLRYADGLAPVTPPRPIDSRADRPLRIGYVSPDFREHSVSFFLLPLLESHDRKEFQVTCYAASAQHDSVTERIRSCVDQWVSIVGDSDERAAQRIRDDRIDILVDLAGHTAHNRLLVFARKPAPVQVTYLGYPNTTGMAAFDWRMTDTITDPPGAEAIYVEKLFRLPHGAWCFCPLSGSPPIQPRKDGSVVFGCFNDPAKINGPLLPLWARILQKVPDSRLLLKNRATGSASVQQWLRNELEGHGISWDRIELMARQPVTEEHLRCYDRIDIALDTYPYHGTTTTCESLWMGVPVITLAGKTHVSRVGASLLNNVGLQDLVAENADGYVQRAVDLANDSARRDELRSILRERMRSSPLMHGNAFARDVENAYRIMWRKYSSDRA